MIRRATFILCLVMACINSKAQISLDENRYADSLVNELKQAKYDSVKTKACFLLSYYWVFRDLDKAQQYLDEGRKLTKPNTFQQSVSYFYEGIIHYANGDIPRSEVTFLKCDSLLSRFDTKIAKQFRSQSWHNYGVLQQAKDDEKSFADILINKAIPLAIEADDSTGLGRNYHDLALTFKNTLQYEKAAQYCLLAIPIFKATNAATSLAMAYITLAENYVLWEKPAPAKPMLDSAQAILAPFPQQSLWLDYYAAEGTYLTVMKQYAQALQGIAKGITLARQLGRSYEEQRLLLQQFYALYDSKEYRKAKPVLERLLTEPKMMSLITNRLQIYKGLAETHAALGEMKPAYEWSAKYSKLSDSVHESKLKNDIQALEIKFNNAENQKKIATLKAESDRATLSARNTRQLNWFLGAVAILLLIVVTLVLLYYRNNRKLSRQKDLNHQQQLKELEQQQQIQFSQAMLEGEERERRRVAGDLHDGLGGMLAGVKINLSSLTDTATESPEAELHKAVDQLDRSITELRRIARNMMPEALLKFGLETALKDLCDSLMSSNTRIGFQSFGIEKNIPQQKQVTIYRIVQELLTNAVRHSHASDILLQCSQNGDTFFVTLEDNGKGFDTHVAGKAKGIGLGNVKSRVDYLNGKMDIESVANEGTTINIELDVAA